jgi:hypothetical protein
MDGALRRATVSGSAKQPKQSKLLVDVDFTDRSGFSQTSVGKSHHIRAPALANYIQLSRHTKSSHTTRKGLLPVV